jgi:hypothetical protein
MALRIATSDGNSRQRRWIDAKFGSLRVDDHLATIQIANDAVVGNWLIATQVLRSRRSSPGD